jgi:hypothetical protein
MKVEFAKELIVDAMKLQEKTLELIASKCLEENAVTSISCDEQTYYSTHSATIKLTNGDILTVSLMKKK